MISLYLILGSGIPVSDPGEERPDVPLHNDYVIEDKIT